MARGKTAMGIRILTEIAKSKKCKSAARVAAIRELFDRGWGKVAQPLVGGEDGSNEIRITVRKILEAPPPPITITQDDDEGS
jgi:hypothetical protein